MPTTTQIRNALFGTANTVGKTRKGTFVARKGFFYSNGKNSDDMATRIQATLLKNNIKIQVVDHGEHWAEFKGRASVKNQSHWWVEFTVTE